MAYFDQFISALHYYFELNPSETAPDFDRLRQHFIRSQSPLLAPSFDETKQFTAWIADRFVGRYPGELAHACHAASAGFMKSWELSRPVDLHGTLAITIGSVRFRGRPVFETTRDEVAKLVHAGRQSGNDVPVHVWLTLDDLTVIDLTLISTLIMSGDLPADAPPVLFWREDCPSEFSFEPVLVDNLFFERIDTGDYAWRSRK